MYVDLYTGCHVVTRRRQSGESRRRRRGSGEAWGDASVTNASSSTSVARFSLFLFCFYRRPTAREALYSSGDFIYVEIPRATASDAATGSDTPTRRGDADERSLPLASFVPVTRWISSFHRFLTLQPSAQRRNSFPVSVNTFLSLLFAYCRVFAR